MDNNDIDKSLVAPLPPVPKQDYTEANKKVYKACKEHPDRLFGLYHINPWFNDKVMEHAEKAIKEWNFKGFKLNPFHDSYSLLHLDSENGPVISDWLEQMMELATKLEVPTFIHTGDSSFCRPEYLPFISAAFPELPIITRATHTIRVLSQHESLHEDFENVYFGSYPLRGGHKGKDRLLQLLNSVLNSEKLLFTTEIPFGSPEFELKVIELNQLKKRTEKQVMAENIKSLIDI